MSPVGESEGVILQTTSRSAWTTLLLPWKLLWNVILLHRPGQPGHRGPQPSSGSVRGHLG